MRGKEKRIKRRLWIALVLTGLMALCFANGAQAAAKTGLVKEKGAYYYYQNGARLKNKWKRVGSGKKRHTYYFGKTGAAYKAKEPRDHSYNVRLYKIGSQQYGFDSESHLVSGGVCVNSSFRPMVFTKKGVYDKAATQALRTQLPAGAVGTDLYEKAVSVLGTPKDVRRSSSCNPFEPVKDGDVYTDVVLVYRCFELDLVLHENTGRYCINGFFPIVVSS